MHQTLKKTWELKKRWIVLTILFAFCTLAVSTYLLYKEVYKPKQLNTILSMYGGLFKDLDEIGNMYDDINESRPAPTIEPTKEDNCSLQCPANAKRPSYQDLNSFLRVGRKMEYHPAEENRTTTLVDEKSNSSSTSPNSRKDNNDTTEEPSEFETPRIAQSSQHNYKYHGCCRSRRNLIYPDHLPNIAGVRRRLVQFERRKQIFTTDVCEEFKNCNRGCRCVTDDVISAAVVVDDTDMRQFDEYEDHEIFKTARIEIVKYNGWCKCLNDDS